MPRSSILLAALLGPPVPALAALPDEIQVYDDSLNPRGDLGVELHVNYSIAGQTIPDYPGEITTGGATRMTPEFSYGLGHGFEAGFYMNGVIDAQGTPWLAGAKARMKYIIHPAPAGGLFYGVNVEVGRIDSRFEPGRTGIELRPILGYRTSDWLFVWNPNLEFALQGPDGSATPVFNPGIKMGRKLAPGFMFGTEIYREFGSIGGFSPPAEQATQVFAVIDVDRKPFVFNFGVGRGFNGADPWIIKAIISLPI